MRAKYGSRTSMVEGNNKICRQEEECEGVGWIQLAQVRV